MEKPKNSSSILISIFKRKGGEGLLTKIITKENKTIYNNQLVRLNRNENALICYKEDELNWLMLTDQRILVEKEKIVLSILFSELIDVKLALKDEFNDRVVNKTDFTRLILTDKAGQNLIKIEKGKPFQGIYQVLHYVFDENR